MLFVQVLISVVLLLLVTACSPSPEQQDPIVADALKRTVGDWMHDIDAAERFNEHVQKNMTPDQITPLVKNARKLARDALVPAKYTVAGHKIERCWKGEVTTANTDHACLDAEGYKRSK